MPSFRLISVVILLVIFLSLSFHAHIITLRDADFSLMPYYFIFYASYCLLLECIFAYAMFMRAIRRASLHTFCHFRYAQRSARRVYAPPQVAISRGKEAQRFFCAPRHRQTARMRR